MIAIPRLILRPFRPEDRAPFTAMNADPAVMRHFPAPLSAAESDALLHRIAARWQVDGIGFAAVERRADGAFLGMVGLSRLRDLTPALEGEVEIGWRLATPFHGQGYATEAARAWLAHGFGAMGLGRILAFTAAANLPSQAVMARIGLRRDEGRDFDHPRIAPGHPLRRQLVWSRAA